MIYTLVQLTYTVIFCNKNSNNAMITLCFIKPLEEMQYTSVIYI